MSWLSNLLLGKTCNWRIVGHLRSGGIKIIYQGRDYCNVSDMMLNPDEPSEEYERMQLFEDDVLIEDVSLSKKNGAYTVDCK